VSFYPDFAVPYKHYARQSITGLANNYVTSEATYKKAVINKEEKSVPGYPDDDDIHYCSNGPWPTANRSCLYNSNALYRKRGHPENRKGDA